MSRYPRTVLGTVCVPWKGDGTLDEASTYLKRNAGIDNMGDIYGQRFLMALQGLKNLGESRDRKDVYRSGEKRMPE